MLSFRNGASVVAPGPGTEADAACVLEPALEPAPAPPPGPATGAHTVDDAILDSAARTVVDLGVGRLTVAEVARRAGVSRPTVYRRWSGMEEVLAALLTREILHIADDLPHVARDRADLVHHVVDITWQIGGHAVLHTVLHQSPDVFRTYVLTRLGASQRALIDVLTAHIAHLQRLGEVRRGDPEQLATMVLLMAQSAMQSAGIVAPILDPQALSGELAHALNGYLAP
ncbi:TetR/AcrR family transcriptional regulator [Tomitella fengzijianii]|uniref:TetR/AcrR family transcriptional regulator n=1 Tax=Tomitella fengzijianii TaxID=2597660 RepID=A0A516X5Q3_9ACTN|nr:TetR/AcrR family transcriptional regulator [Tomitella fengzijianii]QDQ98370.1 TetR/AcrR family transcriptional regulator [Tomitella fengzijianii]